MKQADREALAVWIDWGMEINDYRWLVSEAARPWMDRVASDPGDTLRQAAMLRRDLSAAKTHLVLEQVELRRRAAIKFPAAGQMFFTRKGLEQATDLWLARYKAAKLSSTGRVADLCCGIGGDLLALAEVGPVQAVDADPVVALLADANLNGLGLSGSGKVFAERVVTASIAECNGWHLDPDRRAGGYRTVGMEQFEPPLELVVELLQCQPCAAIKLAPATVAPAAIAARAELEWISRNGECRQQVAWCGWQRGRRATILDRAGNVQKTLAGDSQPLEAGPIQRYVYEPDAAVLAAKLEGRLAADHGLLGVGGGYLTGDTLVSDGSLTAFEVIESMPFDRKRLAAWFARRGIGRIEVKCRDGRSDANRLQRELAAKADGAATVLLAPVGKSTMAMVARRV